MRVLFSRLWADDKGAVIASELVLVVAATVAGVAPGLMALRNSTNASMASLGDELLSIPTRFGVAPYTVQGAEGNGGGSAVAGVGGMSYKADVGGPLSTEVVAASDENFAPAP